MSTTIEIEGKSSVIDKFIFLMKEAGMKVTVEKKAEYIPNARTRKSMENIKNGENLTVCKDREDFWQKVLS
jgi:hypothetical protein